MSLTPDGTYNTRQLQVVVVNSVLVFLSTVAVILRIWARRIQQIPFFADDYVIVVALFLSYGVNIVLYLSLQTGVGRHVSQNSPHQVEEYFINLYEMQLFWNTTLPVIKLSIMLFFMRIFPVRPMKLACRIIMGFLVVWYIAFQTTAIFQCTPVRKYWQRTTPGTCVKSVQLYLSLAATNLLTDVALLILPVRQVWRLQIRVSKKIGLSCVFALGAFICVVSIIRLTTVANIDNKDITWSDTYAHLWTAIETSLGVVVACLPNLMPVWFKLRRKTDSKTYAGNGATATTWQESDGFRRMRDNRSKGPNESSVTTVVGGVRDNDGGSDPENLGSMRGIMVRTELHQYIEEDDDKDALPMHAI